jgi:hypothetical protein
MNAPEQEAFRIYELIKDQIKQFNTQYPTHFIDLTVKNERKNVDTVVYKIGCKSKKL